MSIDLENQDVTNAPSEQDSSAQSVESQDHAFDTAPLSDDEFDRIVLDKAPETTTGAPAPEEPVSPETRPEEPEHQEPEKVAEPDEEIQTVEKDGKPVTYNFKDAPEQIRNRVKELTRELETSKANSLDREFLTDTDKFVEKIKGLSETQYSKLGATAASEYIQKSPEVLIDYLLEQTGEIGGKQVNLRDRILQKVFGDDTLTKEQMDAEREMMSDEERQEMFANQGNQPIAKQEQAPPDEYRQWQEQQRQEKVSGLYQQAVQPIFDAVDAVVKNAGLDDNPADSPQEAKFKSVLKKVMPIFIREEMAEDTAMKSIVDRANEFAEKLDANGISNLQLPLVSFAEDRAGQLIEALMFMQAKQADEYQTPLDPEPVITVPTASSSAPANYPAMSQGMNVTDTDIDNIIRMAG